MPQPAVWSWAGGGVDGGVDGGGVFGRQPDQQGGHAVRFRARRGDEPAGPRRPVPLFGAGRVRGGDRAAGGGAQLGGGLPMRPGQQPGLHRTPQLGHGGQGAGLLGDDPGPVAVDPPRRQLRKRRRQRLDELTRECDPLHGDGRCEAEFGGDDRSGAADAVRAVAVAVLGAAGEHRPAGQLGHRPQLRGLRPRPHPLTAGDQIHQIPLHRDRRIDPARRIVGHGGGGRGGGGDSGGQLVGQQRRLQPHRPRRQRGERHPHHRPTNGRHPIHHRFKHVFDPTGRVRHRTQDLHRAGLR
ncbi:MAG TPA: hypothetical protein VF082_11120 [Jiangellaceae bacterium]